MYNVIFGLDNVTDIGESDGLFVDTNVIKKISEISPGGLIDVGEDTIVELGVVQLFTVSGDFFFDLCSENVLISKHVFDFSLVDWHFLFVSPFHGFLIMIESILKGEVCVLALLCKNLLEVITATLINEFISILLHLVELSSLVSN